MWEVDCFTLTCSLQNMAMNMINQILVLICTVAQECVKINCDPSLCTNIQGQALKMKRAAACSLQISTDQALHFMSETLTSPIWKPSVRLLLAH